MEPRLIAARASLWSAVKDYANEAFSVDTRRRAQSRVNNAIDELVRATRAEADRRTEEASK